MRQNYPAARVENHYFLDGFSLNSSNSGGGTIVLNACRFPVSLPSNVEYSDFGEVSRSHYPSGDNGDCIYGVDQETGNFNLFVRRKEGLAREISVFTAGHEEGHALHAMGRLKSLYEVARELGISFDFLDLDEAVRYDALAAQNLSLKGNEIKSATKSMFNSSPSESIAHIGGLVALVKAGSNPDFIRALWENIDHNFSIGKGDRDPIPYNLKLKPSKLRLDRAK